MRSARGGPLDGPKNLRISAITPHGVTLAWDAAVNSGSFTYVIEASFGYRVGAASTTTSYTWTRDLIPGRTDWFVMWAGDAKGQTSAKSNTGDANDDSTCCTYLVFVNGAPANVQSTG